MDVWYNSVTKEPVDLSAKSRRGLMGLGRKKSTMALKDTAAAAAAATTTNKEGFVTRRGFRRLQQPGPSPQLRLLQQSLGGGRLWAPYPGTTSAS